MNKTYDAFEDYFIKKAKEEKKANMEGRKLAREIIALTLDLGDVLPYEVCSGFHGGEINSVECRVYGKNDELLFNTYGVYFTGQLCNIPKLKRFKASLQRAIKFCEIPKSIE